MLEVNLGSVLATGLACFALVLLVREIPFVRRRLELGEKPWACNLCCASYTAALAAAPRFSEVETAPDVFAALVSAGGYLGVCFLLLSLMASDRMRPPPPMFPR